MTIMCETTDNQTEEEHWTAEEIEEWEANNEGVCPAFRVDHRPERQSLEFEVRDNE